VGAQASLWSRPGVRVGAGLCALALLASACSGSSDDTSTPSPTAPTAEAPCPVGQSTIPPTIRDLTFDNVTAQTFRTTLTVPFEGLEGGPLDSPSVVRAEVKTAESNSPVTFTAVGGLLIDRLGDDWAMAGEQLTAFSIAGTNACVANTYVFATRTGTINFIAQGANQEQSTIEVVTVPEAARNVSMRVSADSILARETVEVEINVTDVFGNRVPGAVVVITTPRKGPGSFFNGSRRAVVLTDERGRASVELVTVAGKGDSLTINVRGDAAACESNLNQFACAEGVPVAGFPAARSKAKTVVNIRQPEVSLISPRSGTRLSAGQRFAVQASTLGVPPGTLAQLKLGDAVVALGSVESDNTLLMRDILAEPTSATRKYSLLVGDLPTLQVDLTVASFGITNARSSEDSLTFSIAAGAWPTGTRIILLRNDSQVSQTTIARPGEALTMTVPLAPGIYQVRARNGGVVVDGERPYPIL